MQDPSADDALLSWECSRGTVLRYTSRVMKLHRFLPTSGDSRTVVPMGEAGHQRPPTLAYMTEVVKVADSMGFEGALMPTGTACEDGAGTALVGSHEEVADRIQEYPTWGSTSSSSAATRTWRRRTGSARA